MDSTNSRSGGKGIMRIIADHGVCIGAGQCVRTDPSLFDQDENGLVKILHANLGEGKLNSAERASYVCPAQALKLAYE